MKDEAKKQTVSLCMIVKNEAETLARAIESVAGLVDEIVIGIDEATTDNSEEIARRYTDKVYRFRWENDFSKARNQILNHCGCRWVFQLDGHEVLREKSQEKFEKVLKLLSDQIEAVGFRLKMQAEDHNSSGLQLRMFRNNGRIKYIHSVHNILNCDNKKTIAFSDIVIDHLRTEKNRSSRETQRNRMVPERMREVLEKNPADTKALYYLGIHAHDRKDYEKAIDYYNRYLEYSDHPDERCKVLWHLGKCYYHLGQKEKAREVFIAGTIERWDLAECYVSLGEMALEAENHPEAEHFFKLACDCTQPLSGIFFSEDYYSWLPYYKLCEVYDKCGENYRAIVTAEKALEMEQLPEQYREELKKQIVVWNHRLLEAQKITFGDKGKKNFLIIDKTNQFTSELESHLRKKFNVQKIQMFLPQYVHWADYVWFDWCDQSLELASQIRWQAKMIAMLRSYECFGEIPLSVKWENVDRLIFVAEHVLDYARTRFPELNKTDIRVIRDGVDFEKFRYRPRKAGRDVAWVGLLNNKKNVPLLLQIAAKYPQLQFHVAGIFQTRRLEAYTEHFIAQLGLDNVKFYGWVDDVDAFLEDKQYILSTSLWEGTHVALQEGIAKGLRPLIHHWPGAERLYSEKWLFNTPEDIALMLEPKSFDSAEYRRWAEENFSLGQRLSRIDELIVNL